jgi:hypothetical protein
MPVPDSMTSDEQDDTRQWENGGKACSVDWTRRLSRSELVLEGA